MRSLGRYPALPLLLTLLAVLALLANNVDQISGNQAVRSLAISFLTAAALHGIFRILFKNWHRAALVAFLVVLLFFSFGYIFGNLKLVQVSAFLNERHRYLIPLWVGLLAIGLYWVSKRIKDPAPLSGI